METNKNITVLKSVDLDKLYKDRKYEKLLKVARFVCVFSIVLNFVFMVIRVGSWVYNSAVENINAGDTSLVLLVLILHMVIIAYGFQSLRILKRKC